MSLFPANSLNGIFADSLLSHEICADAAIWAEKNRIVSASISAHSGQWDNSVTPYLVGPMQAASISDPCTHVIFRGSNQIGKTEFILNVIGYRIDQWPVPMMVVLAKDEEIAKYVEARIDPFVRSCPALRRLVGRTEDGDKAADNSKQKRFPGGQLYIASSWSPNTFREKPLGIVVIDDVDACRPPEEGDLVSLAFLRTNTFASRGRKVIAVSTPTEEGSSTISVEYENSSQGIYEVPCPQCGAFFALWRRYLTWIDSRPDTAHFQCPHCQSAIYHDEKIRMVAAGIWSHQRPELISSRKGFWAWAAYSPFVRWEEMAARLIEAHAHRKLHGSDEKSKTVLNLDWGETYVPPEQLRLRGIEKEVFDRREPPFMESQLPIIMQTTGTDVQKDRLEVARYGWGEKRECWLLEHKVFRGSFDSENTWNEWAEYHEKHDIASACVDSSHFTNVVLDQVTRRMVRFLRSGCALYAIKGRAGPGPVWPKFVQPGNVVDGSAKHVIVYVDNGKDWVYESLENKKSPGPSYIHFCTNQSKDFFRQIYGERLRRSTDPRGASRYIEVQGRRNEALDITVYAYAALWARATFDDRARSGVLDDFDEGGQKPRQPPPLARKRGPSAPPRRGRGGSSWVSKKSL